MNWNDKKTYSLTKKRQNYVVEPHTMDFWFE